MTSDVPMNTELAEKLLALAKSDHLEYYILPNGDMCVVEYQGKYYVGYIVGNKWVGGFEHDTYALALRMITQSLVGRINQMVIGS